MTHQSVFFLYQVYTRARARTSSRVTGKTRHNASCVMDEGKGLTPFLIAMMKAPRPALARADAVKLAAKYGIRADFAEEYIRREIEAGR